MARVGHHGTVQSNRVRTIFATVAAAGLLALAACSGSGQAKWEGNGTGSSPAGGQNFATVKITAPANGAADVPAGTQIAYSAANASTTDVTVTGASGQTVSGGPGYDKNTWVPDKELGYGEKYTVKVTSTGSDGKTATTTTSFTTMAEPSKTIRFQSWFADNEVVGVAAPLVFKLTGPGVSSKADRAAMQKRLTVETTPKQAGSWYWFSSTELHYRSQDHWQPGTKIKVNAKTGGLPMGDGYFGRSDLTLDLSVTEKPLTISIDDKTHTLTANLDGKIKKMPASLGKPSTPSSSGNMVIMTRSTQQVFDSSLGTGGTPVDAPGGYQGPGALDHAPDLGRRVHPRGAVVGAPAGPHGRVAWLHQRVDRERQVDLRQLACRRSGRGQEHRGVPEVGQRLDRLGRELGRLPQGQRAAGELTTTAGRDWRFVTVHPN